MLLHRYFGSHAFETLKAAKLKTSRISSFNDSFEFLYFPVGKQMTPEEVLKSMPFLLNNPAYKQGLKEANERQPSPVSFEDIQKLLMEDPRLVCEHVAKVWPDIVAGTELPIERRRQIIDQGLRAICFSDPARVTKTDEILLWSHYGKKHAGIRMGFAFPEGASVPFEIRKITYQEERVKVVFSLDDELAALKALENSATVKSKVWEYEKEYRLFAKVGVCLREEVNNCESTTTEEHFLKFKREWVKSVDFGVFCPASEIQRVLDLLKTEYPKDLVVKRAQFHRTDYAFDYKEL